MKNFEYSGLWWLPDNPNAKVAGVATFSHDKGIELELIGAFDIEKQEDLEDCDIILGVPVNGKPITLHKCLMRSRSSTGFSYELGGGCKFLVHTAYIGVHLSTVEMFNFNKVSIMFTHLTDWIVRTSGLKTEFQTKFQTNQFSDSFKRVVTYEFPESIKVETIKGNISIGFVTSSSRDIHKHTIEERVRIDVDSFGDKTLNQIRKEFIYPLNNLISFLTDKYNFVEELYLYSNDFYLVRHTEKIEEPIQVFYSQNFYQVSEKAHPHEMILYYEKIADDLPNIFENWLKSAEELDAVFSLYFWLQGAKQLNLVERFLTLIRAIEIYHRRRKNNEVLSKDEHKTKKNEIISSAPEEYRKWLNEKLAFSNEPTLKNRLRELIEEYNVFISPLLENKDKFIKLVVDSRNYYTHYNESLKGKAAKDLELFELSEKLLFLLKSCLLNEIGITIEKQIAIFSDNDKYVFAKSKIESNK